MSVPGAVATGSRSYCRFNHAVAYAEEAFLKTKGVDDPVATAPGTDTSLITSAIAWGTDTVR